MSPLTAPATMSSVDGAWPSRANTVAETRMKAMVIRFRVRGFVREVVRKDTEV